MPQLAFSLENNTYRGTILGAQFEFSSVGSNKYCLIQFLRGFKNPSGKQGLFSQERIARAIPDFEGNTRQSVTLPGQTHLTPRKKDVSQVVIVPSGLQTFRFDPPLAPRIVFQQVQGNMA